MLDVCLCGGGAEDAYQVDAEAETPLGFIRADLLPVRGGVPYVDAAVVGCASEVLPVG